MDSSTKKKMVRDYRLATELRRRLNLPRETAPDWVTDEQIIEASEGKLFRKLAELKLSTEDCWAAFRQQWNNLLGRQ